MQIRNNLKAFIESSGLNYDTVIGFLLCCRFNLNYPIDDYVFSKIVDLNLIERDYINDRIIVKIPLFEDDVVEEGFVNILNINFDSKQYRQLFRGIRTGSMGDPEQVKFNITRWLIENPKYTFEDILECAAYYISNTDRQYCSNADNFIYSSNKEGKIISRLSQVIEEMNLGTFEKTFN